MFKLLVIGGNSLTVRQWSNRNILHKAHRHHRKSADKLGRKARSQGRLVRQL
jgi:hypothetical protein